MQVYNNFRVLNYDKDIGHMETAWYNDQLPFAGQTILRTNLRVPPEFESELWTRDQLRLYWLSTGAVNDVPAIPQWAIDEAEDTYSAYEFKVRIRTR